MTGAIGAEDITTATVRGCIGGPIGKGEQTANEWPRRDHRLASQTTRHSPRQPEDCQRLR